MTCVCIVRPCDDHLAGSHRHLGSIQRSPLSWLRMSLLLMWFSDFDVSQTAVDCSDRRLRSERLACRSVTLPPFQHSFDSVIRQNWRAILPYCGMVVGRHPGLHYRTCDHVDPREIYLNVPDGLWLFWLVSLLLYLGFAVMFLRLFNDSSVGLQCRNKASRVRIASCLTTTQFQLNCSKRAAAMGIVNGIGVSARCYWKL